MLLLTAYPTQLPIQWKSHFWNEKLSSICRADSNCWKSTNLHLPLAHFLKCEQPDEQHYFCTYFLLNLQNEWMYETDQIFSTVFNNF